MASPRYATASLAAALLASLCAAASASAADDLTRLAPTPAKPYLLTQSGTPGGPTTALGPAEVAKWLAGRAIFDKNFNESIGLGTPEMNADSCRACHQDPVLGGAGGLELNVSRFGKDDGSGFVDLPGGQGLSKLRPPSYDDRENYPPDANVFEQRQTPSLLGLGLIDTIPAASILAHEDPDDLDGDGIYGVARIVMINGQAEVGRFGWKAQAPHLVDFLNDAMGGELGLTTPDDGRGFNLLSDADLVADPELSPSDHSDLEFFLDNLGPPIPGGSTDPQVIEGRVLFRSISCATCHVPAMHGSNGDRVHLYSDLLLHDVWGPSFSGMAEPGAPSGFYRTAPLWGIKDTAPYMHDGRAETLTDAIAAHAGEAQASSLAFSLLPPDSQAKLVAFLQDL